MLSKFKRNKHQQHLAQLPKLSQSVDDVEFFYAPAEFREALLTRIAHATQRICIIALYLEQDDAEKEFCRPFMTPNASVRNWMSAFWWTGTALSVAVSAPPPLIPMPTGIVGWPMKIQG